jgi:hypothetical protein
LKPRIRFSILFFLAVCCIPLSAQNYTFQSVECNGEGMSAYGMNGSGVVAGTQVASGAIYYNGTCFTYPSVPFYGISDTNWLIAGLRFAPGYYLIEPGPKVLPLPNYPGANGTDYCCVSPATGTLAGNYYPNVGATRVGFIYQNGKLTSLPWSGNTGPSYWYTIAAMNNAGTVVGTYQGIYVLGFTIVNGKVTLLAYPGASDTNFNGVNDNGIVVGSYYKPATGEINIILYNITSGTWTNLNFPPPYDLLTPVGISNSGVIALTGANNSGLVLATPTGS